MNYCLKLAGLLALGASSTASPQVPQVEARLLSQIPRVVPLVGPVLSQIVAQMVTIEDVGSRPVTVQVSPLVIEVEEAGSRSVTIQVAEQNVTIGDVGSRPLTIQTGQQVFEINDVGSRPVTVLYDPFANTDVSSRQYTLDGTCRVTITVVFSGLADPVATAPSSSPYEWLRNEPGAPLFSSGTATVSNFQLSLSVPTRRPLLFGMQVGTWLRKVVAVNTGAPTATATVVLINGDVNQDNEIGPADFAILSFAFGSEPDSPNWVENADLDRNGEVGPSDFAILATNFGLEGD